MQLFGSNELVEDVFNRDLCVGCGMCVDLCPYFKSYLGKTARLFACDLKQGRCYAYCPKTEVDLDELARAYWQTPYEGLRVGVLSPHPDVARRRKRAQRRLPGRRQRFGPDRRRAGARNDYGGRAHRPR